MKKVFLGLLSFGVLGALAYYSSYLYSDRYFKEHGFLPEVSVEQAEQGKEKTGSSLEDPQTNTNPNVSTETSTKTNTVVSANREAEAADHPKNAGQSKSAADQQKSGADQLKETALPADSVTTDLSPEADVEYLYYLVEELGYVNIYNQDLETIYEYTDIPVGDLPGELQNEILQGKGLRSEQELYDFLENYSS